MYCRTERLLHIPVIWNKIEVKYFTYKFKVCLNLVTDRVPIEFFNTFKHLTKVLKSIDTLLTLNADYKFMFLGSFRSRFLTKF